MPVAREPESGTSVKTSLTLIVIGGVAVGTVAAFVVPWQWLPDAHLWRGATTPWISTARRSDIEAFAEVRRYLGWANYALVLLALGWCALTRAGSRLMSWLPGPWPVRTALGAVSITLATTLISLPIAWWQHTRALHVGLSTQSATAWFRDLALSWLIDAATTALILVLVVGVRQALAPPLAATHRGMCRCGNSCLVDGLSAADRAAVQPFHATTSRATAFGHHQVSRTPRCSDS
ncbi:MAG: hypothetical protein V9E81_03145 [Marmoricola sp.]